MGMVIRSVKMHACVFGGEGTRQSTLDLMMDSSPHQARRYCGACDVGTTASSVDASRRPDVNGDDRGDAAFVPVSAAKTNDKGSIQSGWWPTAMGIPAALWATVALDRPATTVLHVSGVSLSLIRSTRCLQP